MVNNVDINITASHDGKSVAYKYLEVSILGNCIDICIQITIHDATTISAQLYIGTKIASEDDYLFGSMHRSVRFPANYDDAFGNVFLANSLYIYKKRIMRTVNHILINRLMLNNFLSYSMTCVFCVGIHV